MYDSVLSICIPTYNRGKFLDISLTALSKELQTINNQDIELIVSDNCSTDNTQKVVQKHIKAGLSINYLRNETNIGMDGNFVQCFKAARSKYVWVLGDDDFIKKDVLNILIEKLKKENYGLVHLKMTSKKQLTYEEFSEVEFFLSDVSYWITFISSNIVQTKFVEQIDFEKYMGSYFTLIPLYITAAKKSKKNLMVHRRFLENAADSETNGGYNFFQVFVSNYLSIRKEMLKDTKKENFYYKKEKERLFKTFLLGFIDKLYFKKQRGNFKTERGWKILFSHYGWNLYYYVGLSKLFLKNILER